MLVYSALHVNSYGIPSADRVSGFKTLTPSAQHPHISEGQECPEQLPLSHQYFNDALPSSEIDKGSLEEVNKPLEKALKREDKDAAPSTVTHSLAKSAVFGINLMRGCTPSGSSTLYALPKTEILNLKRMVFKASPRFWHSPAAFEAEWKGKCWPAFEQACRRPRISHID